MIMTSHESNPFNDRRTNVPDEMGSGRSSAANDGLVEKICENSVHSLTLFLNESNIFLSTLSSQFYSISLEPFSVLECRFLMVGFNKSEAQNPIAEASATRGLLATDHVILNHGQVTWTTPRAGTPSPTTTPHQREDVSALDRFNVHRCPTRRVFSGTGLEPVTKQATVRYLYHSATAATPSDRNICLIDGDDLL
ncbi:uncharacterized protein TNCV_1466291 [Trichonephila clavipes]|nr:uncharacterized protein TNCV_1466291 [Trichonephila clavipes]